MAGPGQQAAGRRSAGGGSQFGGGGNTRGNKPGEDDVADAGANPSTMTDQQAKAIAALGQAAANRSALGSGVTAAETIMGLMPAPGLGAVFKVGNYAGLQSEKVLADHLDAVNEVPGRPGSVYGRVDGMMYSNTADVPGYNEGLGKQEGSADSIEDLLTKKKKANVAAAQPVASSPTTLLGSPIDRLGAVSNIS